MTTPSSTTTTPADAAGASAPVRFLLLGDSHAGVIGRAAAAAGLPVCGGPIGAGRDFNAEFFDVRDDDIVFRDPEIDELYRGFRAELGVAGLGDIGIPLVCTFGLSAHFFATIENWHVYRVPGGGLAPGFLASRLFDDIVCAMARDALVFYRYACERGLRVLAVMPPQRVPTLSDPVVFMAAQDTIARALTAIGVEVVDLRERVVDDTGFQRLELSASDDAIHGNLAFGRIILAELLDRGL